MLPVKDLAQLGQRIAATHGWPAAKAFKAYVWSDEDQALIAGCASDMLKVFPKEAGTEHLLSAALAVQLERRLQAPVHLVAGTLSLDGVPVRGNRQPFDGPAVFATEQPAWRGHIWVMVGPHIVDAAIFRLANSPDCPPALARHVHSVFGSDKGLYADQWRRSRRLGLEYEPQYVLSGDEVDRLMGAAYRLMTGGER
ncbi:hypothetical protein [Novosphingobium kaempferiae]|uniref:hypothetical protein n=1 Tax=Novosphingobium kaempferiae TaxID=2896849 RepID=UPI001E599930|nr:hypothetical protein [Novosphingobium kaempferiae]